MLAASAVLGLYMALALPTEPVFFGNQNTKFLHGAAAAGYRFLAEDWLAGTRNGLPVFTWLVTVVFDVGGPMWVYALHLLAFAVLAWAILVWHRRVVAEAGLAPTLWQPFLLAALLLHSNQGVGKLWQGVASQYVMDRVFEPANFGALLLLGAAALHGGRWQVGTLAVVVAAAFHPGYVLPGAIVLVAAALAFAPGDGRRVALVAPALGVAALAAQAVALARAFPSTSAEMGRRAAVVLTEIRIPDHSLPLHWFDVDAAFKLLLVLLAVALTRELRIGRFLAFGLAATVALTLATLLPGMETLRLVAPWRTSVVLVPIAMVVVVTFGLAWLMPRLAARRQLRHRLAVVLAAVLVAFAALGVASKAQRYLSPQEPGYYAWMRAHAERGWVVMTPVGDRGFRLATGVPQFVSFQSHPYQDHEVLEWHRRVEVARAVQRAPAGACDLVEQERRRAGLTHVVWPTGRSVATCPGSAAVYRDADFAVFAFDR